MSILIWVQTVCKDYQQTTKVTTSKERVKKRNKVWYLLQLRIVLCDKLISSIFPNGVAILNKSSQHESNGHINIKC